VNYEEQMTEDFSSKWDDDDWMINEYAAVYRMRTGRGNRSTRRNLNQGQKNIVRLEYDARRTINLEWRQRGQLE
jgi:hypothetical protein